MTLAKNFRSADIFARFGGEEFIAILLDSALENAFAKAEFLCRTIAAYVFLPREDRSVSLTVSIGVATLDMDKDKKIDDLIDHADQALYKAKQSGRNRAVLFAASAN